MSSGKLATTERNMYFTSRADLSQSAADRVSTVRVRADVKKTDHVVVRQNFSKVISDTPLKMDHNHRFTQY